MTVVDPLLAGGQRDADRVYFGAWVQVQYPDAALRWYRIVGPDEFDMDADYVSMDSPLGRSLLRKRLDDEVSVELPAGPTTLVVVALSYAARPP
jgi:transcription elongation factor GreB